MEAVTITSFLQSAEGLPSPVLIGQSKQRLERLSVISARPGRFDLGVCQFAYAEVGNPITSGPESAKNLTSRITGIESWCVAV